MEINLKEIVWETCSVVDSSGSGWETVAVLCKHGD
jgi:hypothetical protein